MNSYNYEKLKRDLITIPSVQKKFKNKFENINIEKLDETTVYVVCICFD